MSCPPVSSANLLTWGPLIVSKATAGRRYRTCQMENVNYSKYVDMVQCMCSRADMGERKKREGRVRQEPGWDKGLNCARLADRERLSYFIVLQSLQERSGDSGTEIFPFRNPPYTFSFAIRNICPVQPIRWLSHRDKVSQKTQRKGWDGKTGE